MPRGITPAVTAYRGVEAYAVEAPGKRGTQATEVGLGGARALRGTLAQGAPRGFKGGASRGLRRTYRRSSVGGGGSYGSGLGGSCGGGGGLGGGGALGGELLGPNSTSTGNSGTLRTKRYLP
ncbi:hypothetical protein DL768_006602 [Monosporascus sp. mg162]|nr:hypothetical protein DL768_006602 [Monosporascus sp. mg162]